MIPSIGCNRRIIAVISTALLFHFRMMKSESPTIGKEVKHFLLGKKRHLK